jgi:hypothetical protein
MKALSVLIFLDQVEFSVGRGARRAIVGDPAFTVGQETALATTPKKFTQIRNGVVCELVEDLDLRLELEAVGHSISFREPHLKLPSYFMP